MIEKWSKRLYRKVKRCRCGPTCREHCWPWTGSTNARGYGRTKTRVYGRVEFYVHRVAWALANGRTTTLEVCHSCDHPPCCNPSHLFEGTHLENHQDSVRKGRRNGRAISRPKKLDAQKVLRIKRLIRDTMLTHQEIAKRYRVSQSLITNIRWGKVWSHVTLDE